MPVHDSGFEPLYRELDGTRGHVAVLEVRNTAAYASHVEDIEAYFVIDPERLVDTVERHLVALALQPGPLTPASADRTLGAAGDEEVEYLSAREGNTYPGGFQHRSGTLGGSYESDVVPG